jgi:hypothetical protein
MKLWQGLDVFGRVALLDPDGAVRWLLQFPPRRRHRIAEITATILDSDYDPESATTALRTFSERFYAALASDPDPALHDEVMEALTESGVGLDVFPTPPPPKASERPN